MVASAHANVLNVRVATLAFHARFRLNVAGLPRPVRESSSDEPLEELENSSEDDWIKVPLFVFLRVNFFPKIARSTPVLGYRPIGEYEASYSWAPASANNNLAGISKAGQRVGLGVYLSVMVYIIVHIHTKNMLTTSTARRQRADNSPSVKKLALRKTTPTSFQRAVD